MTATNLTKNQAGHIYHIAYHHASANPGLTTVITQLSGYLASQGVATSVLAAGKAEAPVPPGVGLLEFPLRPGGNKWRYSPQMKDYLEILTKTPGTVFHLHGVWLAPLWLAAKAAARAGIPALLTVHGQLDPNNRGKVGQVALNRLKKLLYWQVLAYPVFRHLSLIHAITLEERDALAHLFPGKRIEVIPNALVLEETDDLLSRSAAEPSLKIDHPYLLFLGRLNPQKGVDILIQAFARSARGRDFHLVIVGPDSDPAYTADLKAMVNSLGMDGQVTFLGPVFGLQKWRLYQDAWAFCAPSRTEVIGLVNLEAAAAGIPVLTTYETGLTDWEESGGILVHPQVESLAQGLEQVFSWRDDEKRQRGQTLRQLIERRYSWQSVGPQWLELYKEVWQKT